MEGRRFRIRNRAFFARRRAVIFISEMKTEKKDVCGWFVFCDNRLLIKKESDGYHIPYAAQPPVEVPENHTVHTVGTVGGMTAKAFAVSVPVEGDEKSPQMMEDLRASFNVLPLEEYKMAGKASQILTWDKNSRYCPACGVPTVQVGPIAKKCPQCHQEIYPRISPAIIVLVKKEDSILLVHARNFRGTFKGLVAGFLEPGETLEECVRREVMEETRLRIKNLKYFDSQPWPYPSGIMIGYVAEYESGTVKLQDEELNAGAFYDREHLPELPQKLSIARRMIDAWLEGRV